MFLEPATHTGVGILRGEEISSRFSLTMPRFDTIEGRPRLLIRIDWGL